MPLPTIQEFPISIIVLAYLATAILLIIMILLFRINGRIASLSAYLSRSKRSAKLGETELEAEPGVVDVGPGSPFEDFLKEDPERRALKKKEQFKAYRIWRSEKGLNWPSKD